jgi:HK97 family phage major capsid protein
MLLLDRLREQFNATQEQVRALTDEMAEAEAPTDEQTANLAALSAELEGLMPRIEQASAMANRMSGAAELLTGVPGDLDARLRATHRAPVIDNFDSFGAFARARANGEVQADALESIERMLGTAEHARAFVDVTTADVPGLLPPAWLRDIAQFIGNSRPFITAFDTRPLPPSGMTVNYPNITQRPQVGKQAAEKTDIASRKTTVATAAAAVETYGGGEDVSVQVLQRTDPSYLSLMLELYAEQMSMVMDTAAIASAAAVIAAGNKLTLSLAAPAGINQKLADGAALIFKANAVPQVFVAGLDVWKYLTGSADTAGRPLFPDVGPSNPVGTASLDSTTGTARGLSFFVDPNMVATKAYMGARAAFTTLLGGVQTLSADNPSKLGRDYAVFEFVAFLPRRPDALVEYTLGA